MPPVRRIVGVAFIALLMLATFGGGWLVGRLGIGDNHRAGNVGEAAADVDWHVKLLAELNRAAVHHARAQAGQLEHLVVADLLDAARRGQKPRVGGINAVDVGIDLASTGLEHRGQGDGRGVAAAAAKCGDVEVVVDPLKAGGDDNVALVEQAAHAIGGDRVDAGLGMCAIRADADLRTGQADRLRAQRLDCHRHQRDADLFTGR